MRPSDAWSDEQALALQPVIHRRDELAIAVPDQRRAPFVGADDALARLAPARMRHGGVDVRPEAVLAGLQMLPERIRALVGEGELDDRLDRFEAIFPRRHQT